MTGFLLVILLVSFGFAISFLELDRSKGFVNELLNVYSLSYGSFNFGDYDSTSQVVSCVIFTYLLSVVLFNLLIAIMGDTYAKVQAKHSLTEAIEKLSLILEAIIVKRPFLGLFKPGKKSKKFKGEKSFLYCAEIVEEEIDNDDEEEESQGEKLKKLLENSLEDVKKDLKAGMKGVGVEIEKKIKSREDGMRGRVLHTLRRKAGENKICK
jgi:hypothetical protein